MVAVVLAFGAVGLSVYNFWAKFSAGVKKELTDADAGFRRLTNTMDPEVLRVWALESARTNAPQKDIVESMPKEIRNLYDEPPEVQPDSSGLTLSWGEAFFTGFCTFTTQTKRYLLSQTIRDIPIILNGGREFIIRVKRIDRCNSDTRRRFQLACN